MNPRVAGSYRTIRPRSPVVVGQGTDQGYPQDGFDIAVALSTIAATVMGRDPLPREDALYQFQVQ